jgi:hypothetical protein
LTRSGPSRLFSKHLKTLEGENTRLKRLLADAMLDNGAPKDILRKKWRCPRLSGKLSLICERDSA